MRKPVKYYIISGRTVEEKRSWIPLGPGYRKPRGTRRAGASSLKKIKANEQSCVLNLARTINCNFGVGDWFIALKYDDAHYPASAAADHDQRREDEYQQAKQILTKKFLPKVRKEYEKLTGKKLPAVWVTANWSTREKHFTRIHHHIVLPNDALQIAEKIWKRIGGLGTIYPEPMTNEGDYTRIAQYMIDNVQGRPAGENRWSGCRGMLKPVITEPVEVSDVEGVQPLEGGIIKDVMHYMDEDGRTVSSYLRQTLPEKVKIRGGQIVLPKRRRRKSA